MNELMILDASLKSDLDWDLEGAGNFYLDFGWEKKPLNPFNPTEFNAALLAVEEFSKRCPPSCEVVFLKSDGNFSKLMTEEIGDNVFSDYLHRLASVLPDEITPVLVFEISREGNFAEMVIRLCRRRFEHFKLVFSGQLIPIEGQAPICVLLPQDKKFDVDLFNRLFSSLKGEEYICIPEELFNEHWDGVDLVIYEPKLTSEMGMRMLEGFEAASGKKSQVETWLSSE